MPAQYLNILALSAIVFLACSFSTPVAALSVDSHGLQARHAHIGQAFAKRAPKRCRARSPLAGDPTTSSSPPATTPVNTPAPPANTPAPPNTPAVPGGYGKACLAVPDVGDIGLAILNNFKTPKVSVYHNWTPIKVNGSDQAGYEFVPTLADNSEATKDNFLAVVTAGYSSHIIGFNEPDLNNRISPGDAAYRWRADVMPLKAKGYQLVSPSVTSNPASIQWMHDFIGACGDDCIDKLNLHWYGIQAQEFINYLQLWYDTFKKPIWVTEFACTNFAGAETCPDVPKFATTVKTFMDNTWWVEHYCPFVVSNNMVDVDQRNRLLNGDQRTDLANQYFN